MRRNKHWAGVEEAGFSMGMWLMYQLYRFLGRLPFRLVLYPVIGYFFLVRVQARRASLDYLQHVSIQTSGLIQSNYLTSFRHFLSFGDTILDKILAQTGRYTPDNVTVTGRESLKALIDQGRGAVLFTAHLGNVELSRALAEFRDIRINVLVHTQHAEKFNRILKKINPHTNVDLMQVSSFGAAEAMILSSKIAAGELVIIAADRIPLTETKYGVIEASFLGATALFPSGPYILAHVLQCPVYLMFCFHQEQQYHLVFEPFADSIHLSRQNRQASLERYAEYYAERLGAYCLQSPFQWYNFYPFWKSSL